MDCPGRQIWNQKDNHKVKYYPIVNSYQKVKNARIQIGKCSRREEGFWHFHGRPGRQTAQVVLISRKNVAVEVCCPSHPTQLLEAGISDKAIIIIINENN